MAKPLVSVVIVCHNDWPHLELAIESALCQSHQPIEVIVVDNDSSDDTEREIRSRFMDRVRYIRQANVGAAGGRNAGFAVAQGKYIQILDGDDVLAPNKIAIHVEHLERQPDIDIVYGDFRTFRSTPDVPADSLFDIDTGRCRLGPCLGQALTPVELIETPQGDIVLALPPEPFQETPP